MQFCPKQLAHPPEISGCAHLANGTQHPATPPLEPLPPTLTQLPLRLLTSPDLTAVDLDHRTRAQVDADWTSLVRAALHLEI